MKNKLILSAFLIGLCASALIFTGCASKVINKAITAPAATHVVQIEINAKKDGLEYNDLTGAASLGIIGGSVSIITVPVTIYTDTNGLLRYATPDVVVSGEMGSKYSLFGSYAITHTFATGRGGVSSPLGGAHQPINEGLYSTNNEMSYSQLITSAGAATPSKTTTTQTTTGTGTNAVTTTITTVEPLINLLTPGF